MILTQEQCAQEIMDCYQQLQSKNSNVVNELYKPGEIIYERQHYPTYGDVKDLENHSQYYYHSHTSNNEERLPEHGHFHCFLRQKAFSPQAQFVLASKKFQESEGKKDALSHVIAIAMNERGLPMALFTVNHWVVQGLWYRADDLIAALDNFKIDIKNSPYHLTNTWMTHMLHLFAEPIAELLLKRDAVVDEWKKQKPEMDALKDHTLEVTSIFRFDEVQIEEAL